MKKSFGITHAIASCEDCSWQNQGYKNAQATGAKHAKHYGHKVHVEVGLSGYYSGRKK